ncbi:MAG: methyltransferase domain-containing protein [Deltaproteobacteria bacterium]|nr:methyltransferase domain-containing protein [Deltaproteobacteria bacterium]
MQAPNYGNKCPRLPAEGLLNLALRRAGLSPACSVLDAAAGTCVRGRAAAPRADRVTCLEAASAMPEAGKSGAEKLGIANISLVEGVAENTPFQDGCFDAVFSRLAFRHFASMEKPFGEMNRAPESGGRLVIIGPGGGRRAPAGDSGPHGGHARPLSRQEPRQNEFAALYGKFGYWTAVRETRRVQAPLSGRLALTNAPEMAAREITGLMKAEIQGGGATGFRPRMRGGDILSEQGHALPIGVKPVDAAGKA